MSSFYCMEKRELAQSDNRFLKISIYDYRCQLSFHSFNLELKCNTSTITSRILWFVEIHGAFLLSAIICTIDTMKRLASELTTSISEKCCLNSFLNIPCNTFILNVLPRYYDLLILQFWIKNLVLLYDRATFVEQR